MTDVYTRNIRYHVKTFKHQTDESPLLRPFMPRALSPPTQTFFFAVFWSPFRGDKWTLCFSLVDVQKIISAICHTGLRESEGRLDELNVPCRRNEMAHNFDEHRSRDVVYQLRKSGLILRMDGSDGCY